MVKQCFLYRINRVLVAFVFIIGGGLSASADEPLKIICVGDTMMLNGSKHSNGQVYTNFLESILGNQGLDVEVFRYDFENGFTGGGMDQFQSMLISEKPQLVTLMLGSDEAMASLADTLSAPPVAFFENHLLNLTKKLMSTGIRPIIMSPPPFPEPNNSRSGSDHPGRLNEVLQKYVLAGERVALSSQVPFVNMYKDWQLREKSGQNITEFYGSDMHPGFLGHMLIAQALAPVVSDQIEWMNASKTRSWDPVAAVFWDQEDPIIVDGNSVILDPQHHELFMNRMPAGPDFTWTVLMHIEPAENCHVSMNIGDHYFDVRNFNNSMVFGGPAIEPSIFEPEKEMAFLSADTLVMKLESKDRILDFSINGISYFSDTVKYNMSGLLSLRTRQGDIRIHKVLMTGDLVDAARKPRNFTIPYVDLAGKSEFQVVVDREPDQYLGHPTTVLLDDHSSIIAVYPKGHGRGPIVMKKSPDGGLTWSDRIDVPDSWATSQEVPTIYKMTDKKGTQRLVMFSGLYPIRMAYSEDNGQTWSELTPIGDYGGIVAISDMVRLRNGDYLAFFHDDGRFITRQGKNTGEFFVYQIRSGDGGLSWSYPEIATYKKGAGLCEPGIIVSPDGRQMAMLLRENYRRYNSMITFSNDEGRSWSEPVELPAALTGDRHQLRYTSDGRIIAVFRDMCHESPTWGDFVGWVGRYDDLQNGTEGQFRFRLGNNKKSGDTGYPGLEILPDGTIVATTYGHWTENEPPYIIGFRFKLSDLEDALAQRPEIVDVFTSGEEGYHTYRIPSVLTTCNGTILAFSEGRSSLSDHAHNDIVMKKSTDAGITWSPLKVVAEEGQDCLNNPTILEIKGTGRIILIYQVYKNGYDERRAVPGYRKKDPVCRTKIQYSDDGGENWSSPVDITRSVKRKEVVTSTATGPGIGIQLQRGDHAGRLIMPFNQGPYNNWKVYAAFSDDQGKTWQMGQVAPEDSPGLGNEVQVAELEDGSVLLNSRSASGKNYRKKATSTDGGFTWDGLTDDLQLPEPECQGTLIRFNFDDGKEPGRLLFANPASQSSRVHGTVRVSYDDGKSWPVSKLIYNGSYAYSCLTRIDSETAGLLFERDDYGKISFTRIRLSWLEDR
jgi:lysophospholipase L1-like esterase